MRKIVSGLFISLDGVVEAPDQWHFPYYNDEMNDAVAEQMASADAMLLGRKSYEEFASFWPEQGDEVPFAEVMNNTPKYVVSTTLESADWKNTTVLRSVAELAELKQRPGKNISVTGSATLVRSLIREGLLDELRLLLHPVAVGGGKQHLFAEDGVSLKLIDSKTFTTGVLYLTYTPVASPSPDGE